MGVGSGGWWCDGDDDGTHKLQDSSNGGRVDKM